MSLPGHELMLALKSDANVLLTLETSDGDQLALPRAVVRHPIRGHLEHLDLVAVRRGEKVVVDIAVVLTGEAGPDVLVDHQLTTISLSAEATHLPESVEVSIEGLSAGQHITAGQVRLPAGATLAQDAEQVVVQGLGQITAEQLEAELSAAEEELGSGQAGAEAIAEAEAEAAGTDEAAGTGDAVAETEGAEGGPEDPKA